MRLIKHFLILGVLAMVWLALSFQPGYAQSPEADAPSAMRCDAQSDIPRTECEALVELYLRTGGDAWIVRTGWSGNPSPCTWYGVTCESHHVTALELPANRLSGLLPRKLAALTQLRTLRLDNNSLAGAIPGEFCALATQLTTLTLDYNLLSAQGVQVAECVERLTPGWQNTQTVTPQGFRASTVTTDSVTLTWQPISYTLNSGGYEVTILQGAPPTPLRTLQTADKLSASIAVTGLTPGNSYQAQIVSFTPAHDAQPDDHRSQPALHVFTTDSDQHVLVIVYFSADNDLAPYIAQIRDRLRRGTLHNRSAQVVYLADGDGDGDTLIWTMTDGVTTPTNHVQEWWGKAELNTADADVLAHFLRMARTTYGQDAARTVVSLIGHGVAPAPELAWTPSAASSTADTTPQAGVPPLPRGVDYTPTDVTDGAYLSTPGLGRALATATDDGANPFDLIFFDQCFQGNLDILYEVRSAAEVFIASPNYAWLIAPYHLYLPFFAPALSPQEMADAVIHIYQRMLSDGNPNAIFRLSRADITALAEAVSELGDALRGALAAGKAPAIFQATGAARYADTTQCGRGKLHLGPPDELIGVGLFAHNLRIRFSQPDVEDLTVMAAADQVLNVLQNVEHTFRVGYPYIQPDEFWDYDDKITVLAPLARDLPAAVVWRASIYRAETPLDARWAPDPTQHVQVTAPFAFVVDHRWDEFLAEWYALPLQPTIGEWCRYTPPTVIISGTAETLPLALRVQAGAVARLQWSAPAGSTPAAYHILARRPDGINEEVLAVLDATQQSYDLPVLTGGAWSFRVAALDEAEVTVALSESVGFETLYLPLTLR